MQRALRLYDSTVGKKAVMALSGIILFGFTIGHLAGNLQAFSGPEKFNAYAEFLKNTPALLWGTRFALLFAILAHVGSAFSLWQRNNAARPVAYQRPLKSQATNYAAKTMYLSGPILMFYIIFHLAHLTLGGMIFKDSALFGIDGYHFDPANPYNNLVLGFQHMAIVIPYVLGTLALGFHLFHGVYSATQSLGAAHKKYNAYRRDFAIFIATILTVGNLSFPIAAWMSHRYESINILLPDTRVSLVESNVTHHGEPTVREAV